MKIAMIRLHDALRQQKLRSRMLLQVHDELVLEAPETELETVAHLTHDVMCQAYELKAPLKVEVSVGENWLEMEEVAVNW